MKTIGIIGARIRDSHKDYQAVYNAARKYYDLGDRICSGGCSKGGDRFAEMIAAKIGLTEDNGELILHRPKIHRGSKSHEFAKAAYERNTLIARDSDILIACVNPGRTGGTEDTIKKWKRFGNDPINLILV